jgi:hypothetical protein
MAGTIPICPSCNAGLHYCQDKKCVCELEQCRYARNNPEARRQLSIISRIGKASYSFVEKATRPPQCPNCKALFGDSALRDKHVKDVHGGNIQPGLPTMPTSSIGYFQCQICGYSDSNKDKVIAHKSAVHGPATFI